VTRQVEFWAADNLAEARACSQRRCHFGAVCQLNNGVAECVCPSTCEDVHDHPSGGAGNVALVCGSDSQTYGSACQLVLFACRLQKDITIAHYGPCTGNIIAHSTLCEDLLLTVSVDSSFSLDELLNSVFLFAIMMLDFLKSPLPLT